MADNDPIEARLAATLAFVDGHVKFAEAKNTALMTANIAGLVGAIAILTAKDPHNKWLVGYLASFVLFAGLAVVCNLLSFLPRTAVPWLRQKGKANDHDDLLSFIELRKYNPATYLSALSKAVGAPEPTTKWPSFYARQIVINARIADRKFAWFAVAMWLTVAGVTTPLGAGIGWAVLADRDDF